MTITFTKRGDVWSDDGIASGYTIELQLTDAEVLEILSQYDPTSSTSPTAALSRSLTRTWLDALKDFKESS
jgi:hypothetical protein